MSRIEELVASAAATEGARIMQICNACRYCEGYCAVFPAMERRLDFDADSLAYLANLCHHCGACFYACQYAPPHEFAVNVPKTFAQIRVQSYEDYAWPRAFAAAYRRHGAVLAGSLAAGISIFLLLALALAGRGGLFAPHAGSFYAVFPHGLMVSVFGAAFLFAIVAMCVGAARFRRALIGDVPLSLHSSMEKNDGKAEKVVRPQLAALAPALSLENLKGGGEGCYVRAGFDHPPEKLRRWFHHFTFYGFLLCFASTSLATVYHYAFNLRAPYEWTSPVVILGTLGGIGLLVGPAGLIWLKRRHDPQLLDPAQAPLDAGFSWLLLLTSATGLALLALRETAAMPILLAIHLGVVLALFLTLPYGKFVHGLYRYLALAHHERETGSSALPEGE